MWNKFSIYRNLFTSAYIGIKSVQICTYVVIFELTYVECEWLLIMNWYINSSLRGNLVRYVCSLQFARLEMAWRLVAYSTEETLWLPQMRLCWCCNFVNNWTNSKRKRVNANQEKQGEGLQNIWNPTLYKFVFEFLILCITISWNIFFHGLFLKGLCN